MSGRPASLRDLYTSPSTQWDFTPSPSSSGPSSSSSASAAASSSKAAAAAASQKIEWGAPRPTQSPVFDLSPSIGDDPGDIDLRVVVKSLIASAVLRYATSAIAMPWEVSKLLLQVQWMPRVPEVPEVLETEVPDDEEEDEMTESLSESYFRDPSDPSTSRAAPRVLQRERPLVKKPVVEPLEYVIPVGKADGVWGMIRRISGSRQEGWLSLWKGLLTSCLNDVLSAYLQRHLHHLFQLVIPGPSIYGPVASHLITGVILSPLDLVRTRLIVQSSMPEHRTYRGPLDALSQIIDHEGGLTGLYFHPHLLFPAILDNALRPLISLFLPSFIGRVLGINEDTHPVAWALTEFVSSCAGLLITLPFETVRRRLQIQTRGGRHLRACVETRPRPYAGVLDTLYRIVAEERSDVPMPAAWTLRPTGTGGEQTTAVVKEELGWLAGTGIGQLYRGFGTGVVASAIVMLLAILAGDDGEAGWAEL